MPAPATFPKPGYVSRRRACSLAAAALALAAAALAGPARAATLGWGDGVNLQPSYFNQGDVNFGWDLMARQAAIQTVRIEIEPAVPLATAQRWLRDAHARGYRVIATYHHAVANGSDHTEELMKAARWWRTNYAALREAAPLVVNLMNEWGSHQQTPASFAAACNAALALVREVYDGPIVVDVPGWAQETHVAREASRLMPDTNLVFSVHIYASAWVQQGANRWMTAADLDALDDCGRPVIIGEFGGARQGGADWSALVDHARAKGWTLIAWAWNGDGEGMNMVEPNWGENANATTFAESAYFERTYAKLRPAGGAR